VSKATKRILKSAVKKPFVDCLVIGQGLGVFDELFDLFDTVFVYDKGAQRVRRPNAVYKSKLKDCFVQSITTVFIDRNLLKVLDHMGPILTNPGPDIFIEDEKVIDRVQSANLYRHKYNAIAQAGTFHVWTCKKDGDFFQ
jgi:hypothetical protein|tara:strand:+ start:985 stop:1404 length:420 start_codon:yes stop_codon:yes gene_type:complete